MQRLSTLVIQKLLDGFFLGLDVVDEARRRIDRLMGRPEEAPFEVVWPEPEGPGSKQEDSGTASPRSNAEASSGNAVSSVDTASGDNGSAGPASAAAVDAKPSTPPTKKPKAKSTTSKSRSAGTSKKRAPASRPKVRDEVDTLAKAVKEGTTGLAALDPDRELGGKRMIARVVYALAAAQNQDLPALSSTEIAHVLTFGLDIETFGTNISRAIRQGTAGLVEPAPAKGKEPKRCRLSEEGRATAAREFGAGE